jgi:hypothetical protein
MACRHRHHGVVAEVDASCGRGGLGIDEYILGGAVWDGSRTHLQLPYIPYCPTKPAFASAPSVPSAAVMEVCPIEHGPTKSGRYLLSRTSLAG